MSSQRYNYKGVCVCLCVFVYVHVHRCSHIGAIMEMERYVVRQQEMRGVEGTSVQFLLTGFQ